MDAALRREWQHRGRSFYERLPGAAAAEAWKRERERGEREEAARTREGRVPTGRGKRRPARLNSSQEIWLTALNGLESLGRPARGAT